MLPYGKGSLCQSSNRRDFNVKPGFSPFKGRESTGNTVSIDSHSTNNKSTSNMSCFAQSIGSFCKSNLKSHDKIVGLGGRSDFVTFENLSSYKSMCDKNMAMPNQYKPPCKCPITSWASACVSGCVSKNNSINKHPAFSRGQLQNNFLNFHPAVRNTYQYTYSPDTKQKMAQVQSQRTGKKSNRYYRYGWKPRKSSPDCGEHTKFCNKSESASEAKKLKCDELVAKVSKTEKTAKEAARTQGKGENLAHCDISSQLSNLSLGEKVAMQKALSNKQNICAKEEKSQVTTDWFNIGFKDSESEMDTIDIEVTRENWDDEIQDERDHVKINDEILDLFKSDDVDVISCGIITAENINTSKECPRDDKNISDTTNTNFSVVNEKDKEGQQKDFQFVLFQRNSNKKCRPSSKKRNRKKTSKHSVKCELGQKRKLNEESNSATSGASAVAFILGSANSHSFSCDFGNSDSDFSFDSDEDSDDSGDDPADLLSCPDFSTPLGLHVICSVKPSCKSPVPKSSSEVEAANLAWKINIQLSSSPKSTPSSDKKVHFAAPEKLTTTHVAEEWCRKGPWEEYARDRDRFNRRICDLQSILDPVLQADHRQKIFERLQIL